MFLKFSTSKLIKIFLLMSVFVIQTVFAQGGLKGKVFDKATGESLPGANVMIKGTSLGAACDLDGEYVLRNIPSGRLIVEASYVGYTSQSIIVEIPQGKTLEQDFGLELTTIEGDVVLITAQAQGQLQAINQQLSSNKIASIVSEARIQDLPDFNAAQAISRLPGVSTLESSGEANKVVIRGLAPQYNQVSVSGISLASTGSTQIGAASQGGTSGSINNDRSVDLTMVTPYMIKSIEVFKSLTPDMNANAIGGVVNMQLREAPTGLHGDVLWQSGYTAKSNTFGNYRTVLSLSNRFFDNAFGIYVLGNAEQYDRNADNMNANYTTGLLDRDTASNYNKIQVTDVQLNRHIETRKRYGGNLILDYKFSSGILRSINMFSRLNSDYQDYFEILNYKSNQMDFRYRAGESNTDVGVNSLEFENDFGFMSVELKAAYTYSKNSLPYSPFYQFRQTGGVSTGSVPYNTHPEDLVEQVNFRGDSLIYLSSVSLFSSTYKESAGILKGDFKIPFNISDFGSGFVKFGGEYRGNTHTNDQNTPYFEPEGANSTSSNNLKKQIMDGIAANFPVTADGTGRFPGYNFTVPSGSDLYDTFLDDKFGTMYWATNPGILNSIVDYVRTTPEFNAINGGAANPGGWYEGLYQTLTNDYEYDENYSALYLMSELNFGNNLMMVGGLRYEKVTSDYTAFNLLDGRDARTQRSDTVTVHPENDFVLPMIQVKFNAVNWCDIRYSYTQTLARPDYHQLSPHYNISYDHNNVWAGNPNLKPAQAYNHDLMVTFHSNYLGLLSIAGFYKEIKGFTRSINYKLHESAPAGYDSLGTYSALGSPPKDGATLNTFVNNPHKAYVSGFEIDWQTRFWYLPFPFDGLLLGLNYTHIYSTTNYILRDEITYGIPGRPSYRVVQVDSSREGRLINQPNDIINAYIGYDYKGFSAKISLVFQGNSVSNVGRFPEQDGFTDDFFRVDVSVRQMLPWEGLQLFADVNNLNSRNNVSRQVSIGGFTTQRNYGLTANLGVRYSL